MKLKKKIALLQTRNVRLCTALDILMTRKENANKRLKRAEADHNELSHTSHYWKEALDAFKQAEAKHAWLRNKIKVIQTKITKNFKEQEFLDKVMEHKITDTSTHDFMAETKSRIVGKMKLPPERKKKRNPARQRQIDKMKAEADLFKRQQAKREARRLTKKGQR